MLIEDVNKEKKMEISRRDELRGFVLFLVAGMMILTGCTHDVRKPTGTLDTPEHHVFTGSKLLKEGKYDAAVLEFKLARELDPKYSPAYNGTGLALGYKGSFEEAFAAMKAAQKRSKGDVETAAAYVGFMRLYTMQKKDNWLDNVEKNYDDALLAKREWPEAHYYMGIAYKESYQFKAAEKELKRVLESNNILVREADEQLELVQRAQRAMPGTTVGRKLALQEKVSRADAAAIFVHELKLDRIYEKEKTKISGRQESPTDITDHPLKTDIETVLRIGLRGLEVSPEGKFNPDAYITRAQYAMMLEDIISTVTHDKKLAIKYIGYPSPFPDVRQDSPYFNAVLVCTTRGIMQADDILTGRFTPEGDISGADALLVIRNLRERLKIF